MKNILHLNKNREPLTAIKDTNRSQRSSLIKKNVIYSFVVKGWSVLVQLMLVPLTLTCLGKYENGVWLTISSVLLWIDNLDIGLGNGLRNKLTICLAEGNTQKAREMVSSTIAMLTIIILPVCLVLVAGESLFNMHRLFHVDPGKIEDLADILIISTILVCSTFIMKFIGNFYMGLQLPAVNNAIVTAGNTLSLLGTWLVYLSGIHSLMLVAIANTSGPLLAYAISCLLTFGMKYRHLRPKWSLINLKSVKELFNIGTKFFVLQISGVILFFSTNIIISQFFTPAMVTPYQIAHRYFMVAMLLFTIICVPYWSAMTDAYAKHDMAWIHRANRKLDRFMLFIFLLIVGMIVISPWVYALWIKGKAEIPFELTVLVGLYQFILIYSTRYSYVLNGLGKLKLQLYVTFAAAVAYIPLAYLAVRISYNVNTLLWVMVFINIPGLVINAIQHHKVMSGQAHGIWNE